MTYWADILEQLPLVLLPLAEILLLAFVIYKILYYMRDTKGATVLAGLVTALLLLNWGAPRLHLDVISWLLEGFTGLLATAVIVIFQPELRRAFAQLGTLVSWRKSRRREAIDELTAAVMELSRKKIGALIVFERKIGLQVLIDDAVKTDIKINSLVVESLFFPNSPLHDGAILIREDRIVAARVILPLSRQKVSRTMGTRHRAALGVTEETDAVVIVVSEETGLVSLCAGGVLLRGLDGDGLQKNLRDLLVRNGELNPEETAVCANGRKNGKGNGKNEK